MTNVLVLIDHPNLDILMMPVLTELHARGVTTEVVVIDCGVPDRLKAAGFAYTDDEGAIERFFQGEGPRLFLNGADLIPDHRRGMDIDNRCFAAGIPTLTIEHAPFAVDWDEPFPRNWKFAADRMAMVGSEDVAQYRAIGVRDDRMVLTGLPQHDSLFHLKTRRAAFPPLEGVALFGRSHSFTGFQSAEKIGADAWEATLRSLIETIAAAFPDDMVRIKPHPAEPFHKTDELYTRALPPRLRKRVQVLPSRHENEDLFLQSRLILTFSASVMLEATLAGVPAVIFDHTGRGAEWRRRMEEAGIIVADVTVDDFGSGLAQVLPQIRERLAWPVELPEDFISRYVHRFDGQSAARVADVVEKMMAGAPVEVGAAG